MTASTTSKIVYNKEIKGKKEDSQDSIILKAMSKIGRACTMREIQELTGLEINVVSRSLNNLRTKAQLIDYFDADFKGRRVHHYFIKQVDQQTKLF